MSLLIFHLLQAPPPPEEESFNLFLFSLLILALLFVALCCLMVLIVALCLIFLVGVCITTGLLSVSIWVGLQQKSATQGFRFFVIAMSTTLFGVMGMAGFYLLNRMTHWVDAYQAVVIGLSLGLIGGLTSGYLVSKALSKMIDFVKKWMRQRKQIQ